MVKSEKEIKAEIKAKSAALQAKPKDTIESLSDEQALDLLEKKWIAPLIAVSYTHLDVYKRQIFGASIALRCERLIIASAASCSCDIPRILRRTEIVIPS